MEERPKESRHSNRLFTWLIILILLTSVTNFLFHAFLNDEKGHKNGLNLRNFKVSKRKNHTSQILPVNHVIIHEHNITNPVAKKLYSAKKNVNIVIPDKIENRSKADELDDKARVRQILEKAGVEITAEIESQIPTWSEVTSLYGSKPKIMGLETCSHFRNTIPYKERMIGPAGMFNTGTNLLGQLLQRQCEMPGVSMKSMLWQVPWGKHNPPALRLKHSTKNQRAINQTNVLPVVLTKDPYFWMGSMCRHSYAAIWPHRVRHCPNLIATKDDTDLRGMSKKDIGKPISVKVMFQPTIIPKYDSLAGLWNEWYLDYIAIDSFPRLIIRFEDLLFHLDEVMQQICDCVGGKAAKDMHIVSESAKGDSGAHSGSSGLLSSIQRYGHKEKRLDGMNKDDLKYANHVLKESTMKAFGYSYPDERLIV